MARRKAEITIIDEKRVDRSQGIRSRPLQVLLSSRVVLLIAFAFTVMADPISSVAYAVEAALRALNGNLALLFPTMVLVIAIIVIISINYHQLIGRFPEGGGAAAAAGTALGEGWAFLPIGALVVDFVLTISISVAASVSAIVAYFPVLAGVRIFLGLGLLLLVAGLTWFGHGGRTVFALMTLAFVCIGSVLLVLGFMKSPSGGALSPITGDFGPGLIAVILAFPVAMALATGVEAPSSAIAQLGQLDTYGKRRFGRITLWLTLGIVGVLTLGITALAVRLGIGIPRTNNTQIADIARASVGPQLFASFQLMTTLLLLSAASSSFQAGPGLLKALARRRHADESNVGILPTWMGHTNRHHTPYWSACIYVVISALVIIAAGADDQRLVLFYAVAVFLSFLMGLVAMAQISRNEGKVFSQAINVLGGLVVTFTLVMNLARGLPIISLAFALLIAGGLYLLWVRAGRPRGISSMVRKAEEEI
jgi:amino acid transporter